MNQVFDALDVCIIGNGFAGMNTGRILSRHGLKCQIFTSGMGSSRMWAGTVDLLNKEGSSLEADFNQFKEQLPAHPYHHLQFKEVAQYLAEFFTEFPAFDVFMEQGLPENEMVLTTLGNQKPCVGAWGTIFRDFAVFKEHTIAILVDFIEFNNSVMHLVAKGLGDDFQGKFKVLRLSFTELVRTWENAPNTPLPPLKLNENQIAQYFDKYADRCEIFVGIIRKGILDQLQSLKELPITCVLFPPILGISKTQLILQKLTKLLAVKVGELVAFSPSLMSQRFYLQFEEKLLQLQVPVHKGFTLLNLERSSEKDPQKWTCTVEDTSGSQTRITTKYVIFATGSLFNIGCVASDQTLRATLEQYAVPVPNSLSPSFEFLSQSTTSPSSNLFACGSATYLIRGGMTDEEEIRYGTGLGLAITTSAKVAEQILSRETNAKTASKPQKRGKNRI